MLKLGDQARTQGRIAQSLKQMARIDDENFQLCQSLLCFGVPSGDGGYQIHRLQRGPGDHMALGEWSGAEGPTVFVDLTPGR